MFGHHFEMKPGFKDYPQPMLGANNTLDPTRKGEALCWPTLRKIERFGAKRMGYLIEFKNLKAASQKKALLVAQYQFEEACAKTLYNLSKEPAPFDPDSPYWIVPTALILAREAGISEQEIVQLVLANNVLQSTREDERA